MTRWIGRWIVGVSVLHTLFGFVVFGPVIVSIGKAGLWNTVGAEPMRAAVAWFMLSGFFMTAIGLAVDAIEHAGQHQSLRPVGIVLLLTTVLGIVLMPASGFWLVLPPIVAMLRKKVVP